MKSPTKKSVRKVKAYEAMIKLMDDNNTAMRKLVNEAGIALFSNTPYHLKKGKRV